MTRVLLGKIAREERTHAELSWAILGWLVERHRSTVEAPLHDALGDLAAYPRPTAVAADEAALVARADVSQLRKHGRLADAEWQAVWDASLSDACALRHVARNAQRSLS